jgi:CubicO group peptidase (beta-lactamase class C family)
MTTLPEGISGECDERFAAIPRILATQLATGAHHGVAVAVHHRGQPVVDVWGGRKGLPGSGSEAPWAEDTMALSFSTTKGPAAMCLHMAMERSGTSYDTKIAEVWPEFAANGKENITIRHALCHEAGVPQIRDEIPDVSAMADWDAMVAMMERLTPLWTPGEQNGYHAINYGWLVGELVRRIDGRPIDKFLAEEITGPLGLDGCFIGTPASEHGRTAPVKSAMEVDDSALAQFIPPDSIAWRALGPNGNLNEFLNSPAGLSTVGPAFTGVFTARSLSRLYAVMERGGELDGVRLMSPETVATATTVQNDRADLVIFFPIRWRLGFMSGGGDMGPAGPNLNAYGHAGFGGSVGLVDPDAEISVAVILDRLQIDLLSGDRTLAVVKAAIEGAAA